MPYFIVTIKVEIEAENTEQAKTAVQGYVDHLMTTGSDTDLVSPEEITVDEAYEV